jgi:ATP-dependent DNA helicase RecQ
VRPALDRVKQIIDFIQENQMNQELFIVSAEKQRKNLLKKQKLGVSAKAYHAGLDNAIRSKTQDEFINDDCKVVCATIALEWVLTNLMFVG